MELLSDEGLSSEFRKGVRPEDCGHETNLSDLKQVCEGIRFRV